jgi:hypothetical protein
MVALKPFMVQPIFVKFVVTFGCTNHALNCPLSYQSILFTQFILSPSLLDLLALLGSLSVMDVEICPLALPSTAKHAGSILMSNVRFQLTARI